MVEQKTKMESEILEQNQIVPHILAKYIDSNTGEIKLNLPLNIKKIVLVASGSSYHCARFAVDLVEKISKIETRAIYSSEFLLKSLIPKDDDTLYIFITQSGETSDTLKSVERVNKETSLPTLCITNNENSSIWQSCDYKVACEAGEEIGIAATKSFTSQMLCLILISLKLIENNGNNSILEFKNTLKTIPEIINKAIAKRDDIKFLVNGKNAQDFGSQGQQRSVALSLKLAEVELMKDQVGDYPILLLADVLSELDHKRQTHLLSSIKQGMQTFITTTSIDDVDPNLVKNPNILNINNGNVQQEEI